jgi:hypothetical protein
MELSLDGRTHTSHGYARGAPKVETCGSHGPHISSTLRCRSLTLFLALSPHAFPGSAASVPATPFSLYHCRTCHSKAGRELGSHFAKRREKMIKIQERRMGEMPLIKLSYPDLLPNLFLLLPSLSPDTYSGLICDRSPFKTKTQTTTQQQAIPKPDIG